MSIFFITNSYRDWGAAQWESRCQVCTRLIPLTESLPASCWEESKDRVGANLHTLPWSRPPLTLSESYERLCLKYPSPWEEKKKKIFFLVGSETHSSLRISGRWYSFEDACLTPYRDFMWSVFRIKALAAPQPQAGIYLEKVHSHANSRFRRQPSKLQKERPASGCFNVTRVLLLWCQAYRVSPLE